MDIKDYKFNVGDEVITIYGEKGKIVDICECELCRSRGFCEPKWVEDNDDEQWEHYISNFEAENGFDGYFKIGKYRFNSFNKDHVLNQIAYHEDETKKYKESLKVIEEYVDPIDKAIEHFKHGIACDYFNEEVAAYAKLAIEALEKYRGE